MPRQYSWRQLFDGLRFAWHPEPDHGGSETASARYCYSVWLRHLVTLHQLGLPLPDRVVEIGPGQSLGVGHAALLSGVQSYTGLDVTPLRDSDIDARVRDDIGELFGQPIPHGDDLENVQPRLTDYRFPSKLMRPAGHDLRYLAPWESETPTGDADLVLSQAVMLLVPNIRDTYAQLAHWLKPGGFMSHALNCTSLGLTRDWNGHNQISAIEWRLIQRRHPIRYTQFTMAEHIDAIQHAGCRLIAQIGGERRSVIVAQRH